MSARVHDLIGVGVGPFNLGLACLAAPLAELDCLFLDERERFDWHPGMMLPDSTVQVPFLADLVTMADPTSPYSFLAHLKQTGRLYAFYVREDFHPLRTEYADYCRWVADRLPSVRFRRRVVEVGHDPVEAVYRVTAEDPRTGRRHMYRGRRLVIGTGTRPAVPAALADLPGPAFHSADYLARRDELLAADDVTVVGSGQSAAEIVHDLLGRGVGTRTTLQWITRSPRFFPLEYTKLTLEMTSPEYVRHFHGLPQPRRDALLAEQQPLYKGISAALVDAIHAQLYSLGRQGPLRVRMTAATTVESARADAGRYVLDLRHRDLDATSRRTTSALVTATGYREALPAFLAPVRHRLRLAADGRPEVTAHYAIDRSGGEIFVQNGESHTHGLAAPDLGMGAYRNSVILREVLGHAPYPVEERTMFQEFGVGADDLAAVGAR